MIERPAIATFLLVLLSGCTATPAEGPVSEAAASLKERQALYIDGKHVGFLTHFDERGLQTELAITSTTKPIKDWIEASLNQDYQRKSGSIVTSDFGATRKRDFVDARIVGISFPNADGTSWKGGSLVVRLDGTLSPARDASDLPAPGPITSTLPRVNGIACNCNAVSIRDVAVVGRTVTATVGVEGAPTLEFTAAEPKSLSVELVFDDFEDHLPLVDVTVVDKVIPQPSDSGVAHEVHIRANLASSPNGN